MRVDVGLSDTEKEILRLYLVECLTVKKIAKQRNKTVQSVYKILRGIRDKGMLSKDYIKVENRPPPIKPLNGFRLVRLHGQQFKINIIKGSDFYERVLRERGNRFLRDGNTVLLYPDCLMVHVVRDFVGESVAEAAGWGVEYLWRFLRVLEDDLRVILVKERVVNVKLVSAHYAEVGNELAVDCKLSGDKIQIFGVGDRRLWCLVDDSFGLEELEAVHPERSRLDMEEVVRPFFNDLRENRPLLLSDLNKVLDRVVVLQKETAEGLRFLVGFLGGSGGGGVPPPDPFGGVDYVG